MRKKFSRDAMGARWHMLLEYLEPRTLLSLTHLYTFNDGTANDSAGTAHGTLFNGAVVTNGKLQLQNAGLTSGSATVQYAKLPNGILPATGSATVEAWYTTNSANPNWMRVFDFGNGGAGQSHLFFSPKSATNDARTVFTAVGGADVTVTTAAGTNAAQGYTNMVAVVVDAAAGTLSLYLNGALVGSGALAGQNIGAINETLAYLGRSQYSTDAGFSGGIDEVRIYDEARTAEQVAADDAGGSAQVTYGPLPTRQIEKLNRGIVALPRAAGGIYLSWRLLATDPAGVGFNVYRSANGGAFTKVNGSPVVLTTDYSDTGANRALTNVYYVKAVVGGVEQAASASFTFTAGATNPYLSIPLQIPAGGVTPSGEAYTYNANDASVGDVDGDGQYEIILKWDPSNSKDNSQAGYTGNVYIDAYRMDGTQLWRIDLGRNIRAGAHYTQFQVYDLDGDGRAEVAMRTAPGTVDGTGNNVLMGTDTADADYRRTDGYVLSGPEYLTIFNGLTGAEMTSVAFSPARGTVTQWGDGYGNRVDRFLAGVAYLDGVRPSLIMARGYYGPSSGTQSRNEVTAYNWRDGKLSTVWSFKAALSNNNYLNSNYIGQGSHSLMVGDLDGDGKDEIGYGAMAIDDDGRPMWSTGLGHGDATHISDMDPTRPGLEIYQVHESPGAYGAYGADMRDARTGEPLFAIDGHGADVGRGVAFDVDPRYLGYEAWDSADGNMYDVHGNVISVRPGDYNFGVWWDADLSRELLDGTKIDKWNYTTASLNRLVTANGSSGNNGTKNTPSLSGDIMGDWREEVLWRAADNSELRLYSTTTAAAFRLVTLMQDVQYRESIAWQNTAYNQPPAPSFYLGTGMAAPPAPRVYLAVPPPSITNFVRNDGAQQASVVSSLSLTFNTPVALAAGALLLTVRGGNGTPVAFTLANPSQDGKTYVLTIGAGLPDGIYDLKVAGGTAPNEAGTPLAGDVILTFHKLYGDYDGNKTVNNSDYFWFNKTYGLSTGQTGFLSLFDFNSDGTVNNADYFQFKARYGVAYNY